MASTFAGQNLFASGPHRFRMMAAGRLTLRPYQNPNSLAKTVDAARLDIIVEQTGRLTAATPSALWTLADAIRAHAELPTTGTLIDHHSRVWTTMTITRFEPADIIDRGRVVSMAYRIVYVRFQ